MAKVVFINRFFFPDHSATSQLLSDLAFDVAGCGNRVVVIASRQKYEDPDARLSCNEVVKGVSVRRIWTTSFGRRRLFGRVLDYITFYVSALMALLRIVGKGDVVVAKTDPPMISVIAALIARIRGAVLINWLQDLFPEVARELKVPGMRMLAPVLGAVRNYSLHTAIFNVVIGEQMGRRIQAKNVGSNRIVVIHNWSDGKQIYPQDKEKNILRREWGLSGRFVVGYSGNFGRAHEFETILRAVSLLRHAVDIVFLFIGGGAQYDSMRKQAADSGLENVVFKPYQPREKLLYSLCVPDVHLVTLQPALEGLIVPSKFYGIAAAGRPTIYIGASDGEVSGILRESDCGITIAAGDDQGLRDCIYNLYSDSHRVIEMGRNARVVFEEKYDKPVALTAWRKVVHDALVRADKD